MTKPVTKVEFGFTQTSVGVYSYTDITSYVRSVDVSRGLSRDLDSFSAATCNITLDNRDRAFDPSYSSSPFYGQVKPQASIRVTAGGEVIFTGYVDSWTFDYSIQGDQTASLSALDGTTRIANANVPAQVFTPQYASARLGAVVSSTAVAWSGGTVFDVGQYVLDADTVSSDTSAWDYIQQVAQADGGAAYLNGLGQLVFKSGATSDNPSTRTTYRYNLCKNPNFETNSTNWSGTRVSTRAYKGTYSLQGTTYTDWAYLPPVAPDSLYGCLYTATTPTWVQNVPYTFSIWVYSTLTQNVTINAGFKRTGSPARLDATASTVLVTANTWTRLSTTATPGASGMTANLGVATDSGTLYVDAALIEQTAVLSEFFDGTYGPADTASVDYTTSWDGTSNASTSTMSIVTTYSPNAPEYVALSDSNGTAIKYAEISVVYGSEQNYNKIEILRSVTSTGGSANNATNGSAYGIRIYSDTTSLVGSDVDAQALAYYYLGAYEEPELRVESVKMLLHDMTASDQTAVLGQDIWDAAQITFTPGGVGSAIVNNQKIIGISHSISPIEHSVTWNLGTWGNKFRLDSTLLGVLDTNILGY